MWELVSGIASGLGSWFGAKKSADSAKAINDAQIAQADKQWERYVELANTSHQREVKDLLAAGLSPVLSANSGAPAAMSSMPTLNIPGAVWADAGKNIGQVGNQIISSAKMMSEKRVVDANVMTAQANAASAKAESIVKASEAWLASQKTDFLRENPEYIKRQVIGESNKDVQGLAIGGWDKIISGAKEGFQLFMEDLKKRPLRLGW